MRTVYGSRCAAFGVLLRGCVWAVHHQWWGTKPEKISSLFSQLPACLKINLIWSLLRSGYEQFCFIYVCFFLLCFFPLLLLLGCLWQKTASLPSPVLLWDGPVNHSWRHPDNMYVKISNGTQRQRVTAEALKVAVALRDSQRSADGKQTKKQQCGGKGARVREAETKREREQKKVKSKTEECGSWWWELALDSPSVLSLCFNLVGTPLSGALGLPGTEGPFLLQPRDSWASPLRLP